MMERLSELENEYKLPPRLLSTVMNRESSGNPNAVSPKGAQGLFQFMPETAKQYGIDPMNPEQAATGAAKMFSDLLGQYNGDVAKSLAAYNWGQGNVAKYGMDAMPKETRDYIAAILPQVQSANQYAAADNVMSDAQPTAEQQQILEQIRARKAKAADAPTPEKQAILDAIRKRREPSAEAKPLTASAQASVAPEEPSVLDELARGTGLTARYGIEGLGQIANLGTNAVTGVYNDITGSRIPDANSSLTNLLTRMGLPEQPKDFVGNAAGEIAKAGVGLGGTVKAGEAMTKAASKAAQKIGAVLAEKPAAQAIATATGVGAGEVAKESGAGPIGQGIATIAGGITPHALGSIMPMLKTLLTGGATPQDIQSVVDTFSRVGATATAGQATQSPLLRGIENIVGKTPGGTGPITARAEAQQKQIGQTVDDIASKLSTKASGEQAGRMIEKGIESGIRGKKNTQRGLYNSFDALVPPDTHANPVNTLNMLDELVAPVKGMERTSSALTNSKISELRDAIRQDIDGDTLAIRKDLASRGFDPRAIDNIIQQMGITPKPATYEALKKIRTRIGSMIDDSPLISDIPTAELRKLYGALSEDMKDIARATGPQAEAALSRANKYTSALHDRADMVQGVVNKEGGPEKIFRAATSGTAEGATTFRTVMKTLPKEAQETMVATMLKRLGRATPGKQDDLGTVFSTETFLTNWNKLSKEAKDVMTGTMGPKFKEEMDNIASVASNLRDGNKIYANPSGTAPTAEAIKTGVGILTGAFLGDAGGVGIALAGMAGMRGAGKLLTNPKFVQWLAKAPKDRASLSGHIARLSIIAAENPDIADDVEELQAKLESEAPAE